jgi:hypothetical protein
VHEQDAHPVGSGKGGVRVRRALLSVVEATDPDVVVRRGKTRILVHEGSHARVGEPSPRTRTVTAGRSGSYSAKLARGKPVNLYCSSTFVVEMQ